MKPAAAQVGTVTKVALLCQLSLVRNRNRLSRLSLVQSLTLFQLIKLIFNFISPSIKSGEIRPSEVNRWYMEKIREQQLAKAVGKAIASKRLTAGLTQEEVAESLGIGYEAVSRMERGLIIPTVARLVELAETLDCDVAELITQISDRAIDQAQVIAQKLQRLTATDRAVALDIMDILTNRLAIKKEVAG